MEEIPIKPKWIRVGEGVGDMAIGLCNKTVSWRDESLITISAGEKKDPCIDP